MRVVVNGEPLDVISVETISYELARKLAGLTGAPSVTWKLPNGAGGILTPGDRIAIAEGLVINVCHTGNA